MQFALLIYDSPEAFAVHGREAGLLQGTSREWRRRRRPIGSARDRDYRAN